MNVYRNKYYIIHRILTIGEIAFLNRLIFIFSRMVNNSLSTNDGGNHS